MQLNNGLSIAIALLTMVFPIATSAQTSSSSSHHHVGPQGNGPHTASAHPQASGVPKGSKSHPEYNPAAATSTLKGAAHGAHTASAGAAPTAAFGGGAVPKMPGGSHGGPGDLTNGMRGGSGVQGGMPGGGHGGPGNFGGGAPKGGAPPKGMLPPAPFHSPVPTSTLKTQYVPVGQVGKTMG